MTYTIDTSEGVSLTLNPTEAEAVVQNMYCLLQTTLGEIPCYRDYGINKEFVSTPITVGQNMAISAIASAMARYFPELEIEQIEFDTANAEAPDQISARIEVTDGNE